MTMDNLRPCSLCGYGYIHPTMLPLTRTRAAELARTTNLDIYFLYRDNTHMLTPSADDIDNWPDDCLYGVKYDDWLAYLKMNDKED